MKESKPSPHPNLILITLVNSMFTLLPVGYQMTVLNSPQRVLEVFVNDSYRERYGTPLAPSNLSVLWSFTVSCLSIGGWLGCFLSVPLREAKGLKDSLMIYNNITLLVGCAFFAAARWLFSFECLIFGRLVMGVHGGCGMALVTGFIQECSPARFRGSLSCLVHICIVVGAALGPVLGMANILGNEENWPYLLTLPGLFAFMQFCFYPMTHESPIILHENKPNCDEAIASIRYYYGPDFEPREVLKKFDAELTDFGSQYGLWDAVQDTKIRWGLFLAALVNFSSVFTGVMALISYSTVILQNLGLPMEQSQEASAGGGVLGGIFAIVFTVPTLVFIESTGRRRLFLPTMLTISIVDFLLVILGTMIEMGQGGALVQGLFLFSMIVFVVAYNIGPGPIQYFIPGELAPENYRTTFLAVGVSANWFATMLSTLAFYPVDSAIGSRSFLMFAIPTLLATILFTWKLPETRTKSVEELNIHTPLIQEIKR